MVIAGKLPGGTTNPAPRVECFIPSDSATGTGLIILPGGGYGGLAEHEGKGYAERFVTAETPPCFMWHTLEDVSVPAENSMLFASALRQRGVRFELHIYPHGRHGLGLGTPFKWADECVRWMNSL